MSLLNKGNADVLVFPEEATTSRDGNPLVRPSMIGITARAMIQPITTATDDQDGTGDIPSGPTRYRLRFVRADERRIGSLGRASQIEWNGQRWHLSGDPLVYGGSYKTTHTDYVIGR
jgi:hypothetical protein